jgi:hypothetical protein
MWWKQQRFKRKDATSHVLIEMQEKKYWMKLIGQCIINTSSEPTILKLTRTFGALSIYHTSIEWRYIPLVYAYVWFSF